MEQAPTSHQLARLEKDLQEDKTLPSRKNAEQLQIAYSHVFRKIDDALAFANNIMLGPGQELVGGRTEDSIGNLWWIGVRYEDIEQWRANGGYHHAATFDPEAPKNEML